MRRLLIGVLLIGCLGAAGGPAERVHEARWAHLDVAGELPIDLTEPEGKSRWNLAEVRVVEYRTRTLELDPGRGDVVELERLTPDSGPLTRTRYVDAQGRASAERWLFPQLAKGELTGPRTEPIELVRERDGAGSTWRIEVERAGLGWVMLPAGPREVYLQRALLLRRDSGERGFRPDVLIHRWVDPRAGVVAEVRGPVSSDGKRRLAVSEASVVEQVVRGGEPLRLYVDSIDIPSETRLRYGYDRGEGVLVSALTPDMHADLDALTAASAWNFSGNTAANSVAEIASTRVDLDSSQTCSFGECGLDAGFKVNREDRDFEAPDPLDQLRTMTVDEREDRAGDVTLWLRAGINNDGQPQQPILDPTGGESRFCYIGNDHTGLARTRVPLWRFSHDDGSGNFYAQNGDGWSHTPFNCEADIFPYTCPNDCVDNLFSRCPVRLAPYNELEGTQSTDVINEGLVTLPSGHVFNSLLARSRVAMGIFDEDDTNCNNPLNEVLTFVYLWEVPNIGTVVRLATEQRVQDPANVTDLDLTDIKYGLLPPLSISVGAVTETSVELSWNPGAQDRIDAYRIYWGTDSGSVTPYANDVIVDAALGTSTTIGSLDPATEYFFTVTTISDYCDVANCDPLTGMPTTRYESVKFPITAPASPTPVPMEVSATTGGACTPTAEVGGVTLNRVAGSEIEICWDPVSDPCLEGYQILGAASAESDAGFSVVVPDTGLTTCHSFDPSETYLLVVARGSGGTGPWGHYGR